MCAGRSTPGVFYFSAQHQEHRAGADPILTYAARDAARWLKGS